MGVQIARKLLVALFLELVWISSAVRITAMGLQANKVNSTDAQTSVNVDDGATMTFYVYRAQGPAANHAYAMENVNVASLGGVMWYLHNEIIYTCHGEGGINGDRKGGSGILGERKFNISRILRFKLSVKPTAALLSKGIHFSGLTAFDAGKASGPFRDWKAGGPGEWKEYGYTVGCGKLGEYPHKDWTSGKKYPNAIWYSLIGPCATKSVVDKTESCKKQLPGGHCPAGVMPTGAPDCTYQYEEAGEIDIDELVGITPKWANRAEFCKQCQTEGDGFKKGGCGLDFWGGSILDQNSDYAQVDSARKMFEQKYPDSPKESDLPNQASCDFDQWKYGYSWLPWRWR